MTKTKKSAGTAAVTYVSNAARVPSLRLLLDAEATDRVVALHIHATPRNAAAPFATIALAMGDTATVLSITSTQMKTRMQEEIAVLLADASITKVFFGVTPIAQCLQAWFDAVRVKAVNVLDLELSLSHAEVKSDPIVQALANQCRDVKNTYFDAMQKHLTKDPYAWSQPMIASPLVQYAANQAGMCLAWYAHLAKKHNAANSTKDNVLTWVASHTVRQWQSAVDKQGIVGPKAFVAAGSSGAIQAKPPATATVSPQAKPPLPTPVPAPAAPVPAAPRVNQTSAAHTVAVSGNGDATAATSSIRTGALEYVTTTAALRALIQNRGEQLFCASETPTVAVHFHTQSVAPAASLSATASSQSTSGSSAEQELLAITLTGLPPPTTDDGAAASCVRDTIVLHLLPTLDCAVVAASVARLLRDHAIVKVVHAVHAAAFALSAWAPALQPVHCVDLQLAFEHAVDPHARADLARIATHCAVPFAKAAYRDALVNQFGTDPLAWRRERLSKPQLQSLRHATHVLLDCYDALLLRGAESPMTAAHTVALVAVMTTRRWGNAVVNRGVPSIWFDVADDYAARSLECLECLAELDPRNRSVGGDGMSQSMYGEPLESLVPALRLECDLTPLLALLPAKYRAPILAIDGFHDKLVDICLDIGRVPHVYVGKGQRIALVNDDDALRSGMNGTSTSAEHVGMDVATSSDDSDSDSDSSTGAGTTTVTTTATATAPPTVTHDDIDEVLARLGGPHRIGFDNRAGIDRQLHRVSVMRSKTGEIFGLTMRVGRALQHAANVLQDVLMSAAHRDKSVLLLGRPGSGKTTLIRDVARCIAATGENVCIIDTSNEIGGDGLVPHDCVGWARRMMVPALEQQASVMIECVQNHTVETLVIDEIGRKAEVLAASTVRQRGPRIIASGHGDFRSLIKNPDLKGLVGGVQQVTVGDAAAATSVHKSKLQAQRAGAPIFDIIVELDHIDRGRCRIIWDVADAVDTVLRGEREYASEVRKQHVDARGILQPQS